MVVVRHCRGEFLPKTLEGLAMLGVCERRVGHAFELLFEDRLVILQDRIEKFVKGAVVAECERKKSVFDFCRDFMPLEELRNVEEISRMLSVERGAELAAVEFGTRKNGHLRHSEESLCRMTVGELACRKDRSAQDVVRLDFDDGVLMGADDFANGVWSDEPLLSQRLYAGGLPLRKKVCDVQIGGAA